LPGDGVVYRTDSGERVELDSSGRKYSVNQYGRRPSTAQSDKPAGIPSFEWRGIKTC
jgi:hypothetical protein